MSSPGSACCESFWHIDGALTAARTMRLAMTTFVPHTLPPPGPPPELWDAVAAGTLAWCREQHIAVADTVVLVPFADLLAPARAAFAQHDHWLPRLHTPRTLAAALGPPMARSAGELTGDAAIDRITA